MADEEGNVLSSTENNDPPFKKGKWLKSEEALLKDNARVSRSYDNSY